MKAIANILTTLIVVLSTVSMSQAQVRFTSTAGGENGLPFMIPANRSDIVKSKGIKRIAIQHSRRVEKIIVEYSNENNQRQVESIGNNAGQWSFIDLKEDEFITYVTGQAGTLIDQITFHTSQRRTFGPYGGSGGQYFELTIPSNAKVIGFSGKVGPCINQIGLIYKISNRGNGITNNSERGTKYNDNDTSGLGNSTNKIVRDHRKKKSKFDQGGSNVRDHRTSSGSRPDVSFVEKKDEEKDTPMKRFAKKFWDRMREIGKANDEEVKEEESPKPSEQSRSKT